MKSVTKNLPLTSQLLPEKVTSAAGTLSEEGDEDNPTDNEVLHSTVKSVNT